MSLSLALPAARKREWGARALFALVDQGMISGSNFLLGVQLARCLDPARYGAYALAFSIFSLLSMVHQAIVLEPMSVFGGSKYRTALRQYISRLLGFQTAIGAVCLFLLLIVSAGMRILHGSRELRFALLGIAFATPCILLLAFTRRALYLEYRSNTAACGAALYSAFLFLAFLLLRRTGIVSPFAVFLEMGTAALAASILLLIRTRRSARHGEIAGELALISEHWCYGRWALGSTVFIWISWNVWYAIVGSLCGLAATGALKALINLAMPIIQSCAALTLLVLPHTAQVVCTQGLAGGRRQATVIGLLFTTGATFYWTFILLCHKPLIAFLYAGQYGDVSRYLPLLAVASIASATIVGPVSALRSLERPSTVCLAFFIASLAGVCIGIPATRTYGVGGAIAGILISSLVALGVAVFTLGRTHELPQ